MQLKKHERGRDKSRQRNMKGKKSIARIRQLKKQRKVWRKRMGSESTMAHSF